MPRLPLFALLSVLASTAAANADTPPADGDPAAALVHAYYTRGCGPVDQPVTMIYLTKEPARDGVPSAPYVQLWFSGGLDENGRYEGSWDAPQDRVGGTWCPDPASCRSIPRGQLRLERSTEEGTLNGEIQFDVDGLLGGGLRALPLPAERMSCG